MITAALSTNSATVTPDEAKKLILSGQAPANLRVRGSLNLSQQDNLTALPEGLQVTRLDVSECRNLRTLPRGLRCFELHAQRSGLETLPADLQVENKIDLSSCDALSDLPVGLKTGSLILNNCRGLIALPENLSVSFLEISGCSGLRFWPKQATVRVGRLVARDCKALTTLPDWLSDLAQLDVAGCENLTRLPEGLRVTSWLDIAGTGITELPDSLRGVRLRWRGVLVDERVVFRPETLTGQEALATANAEVRRVMIERMGYERFLSDVKARERHRDTDPGGERRLLCVPMGGDEDLVCLAVSCPSTGRRYMLRVPPTMRTCHQAAAWIAGFDNANDYRPLQET